MTRLQSRSSSCECKTTTKESKSFVTENKIYETRSSGRNNRTIFSRGKKKKPSVNGERNVKKKLFIDKVTTSRTRMPQKDSFKYDKKAKTLSKNCDEKISSNGTARTFINDALNDLITQKLKMEMIDSTCVRSNGDLEDITLSNDFISNDTNGIVSNIEVVKHDVFQNDGFQSSCDKSLEFEVNNGNKCLNGFDVAVHTVVEDIIGIKEETTDSPNDVEPNDFLSESKINCSSLLENHSSPDSKQSVKKRRKPKKTKLQSLLEAYEEITTTSLSEKRSRKGPENYSPPLKRKIKFGQIPSAEKLTLSGKIRKKCGPKPKPKGPVLHYLDIYVKNKELVNTTDNYEPQSNIKADSKTLVVSNISSSTANGEHNDSNGLAYDPCSQTSSVKKFVSTSSNLENVTESTISCENNTALHSPIFPNTESEINYFSKRHCVALRPTIPDCYLMKPTSTYPFKNNISMKHKPMKGKQTFKKQMKQKLTSKLINKPFDNSIQKILGYRCHKGNNEILVLFKNGTSNWIKEDIEGTKYFDKLDNFYEHVDQDISIIHRIGYQILQRTKSKNTLDKESETDTCSESDYYTDTDYDDFILEMESKRTCIVPLPVNIPVILSSPVVINNIEQLPEYGDNNSPVASKTDTTAKINGCVDEEKKLILTTEYQNNEDEIISSSDLNELCSCVMSSRHIKLYPYETTKEIVVKTDGEFVHIYLKRFKRISAENTKKYEDGLNLKVCEYLINTLEDCAMNDNCNVVVLSGIEVYFSLNGMFDKLLKKSSTQGKTYEQDISILRYLVQTIRNFNKPIVAVIRKTACGLPASLLSLFDMVFDERSTCSRTPIKSRKFSRSKSASMGMARTPTRSQPNCSTDDSTTDDQGVSEYCQNFFFPRLMGLSESNEAQIMGEQRNSCLDSPQDIISDTCCNKTLSQPLRNSVRNMKNNSKMQLKCRGRSQSLNSIDHSDTANLCEVKKENVEDLEKQVQIEKEMTKKLMDEFSSFLKSIESNSFV